MTQEHHTASTTINDDDAERANVQHLALALVERCVRNTQLETLHTGITPSSETGDYTDVKIVTPYGEIPWARLSRISDAEMKSLMIEITNKVFTFLMNADELAILDTPRGWNIPETDADIQFLVNRVADFRHKHTKQS